MTDDRDPIRGDDELRALLRSLDPAASLPPADPTGVARLLEDTMTDQLTDESRSDHARGRSRLTWLVAAAAAVLIGGGVLLAVGQGDDDTPVTAGDGPSSTAPAAPASSSATDTGTDTGSGTVTDLTASGGAGAQKCLTPEAAPDVVASQSTVLDGVVESISGSVVTLRPSRFYAGDATDLVTVTAPSDDMRALLSAVRFEEGKRYLVAATDGRVTFCGFSAEYTDALARVYETAFAG